MVSVEGKIRLEREISSRRVSWPELEWKEKQVERSHQRGVRAAGTSTCNVHGGVGQCCSPAAWLLRKLIACFICPASSV
ncbi:hypothetical protein EUGRSUZ_G02483 [Eucalyptus grandis]|uniref:Uncharacterized protein n=2 Tax=Eucalyptus grandis TaxID=71139 RepID=A0ACC3K6M7_EUCGR|nr:hypothetical protein EUGRSUZ_G02483 [Eucalyptus grandis]